MMWKIKGNPLGACLQHLGSAVSGPNLPVLGQLAERAEEPWGSPQREEVGVCLHLMCRAADGRHFLFSLNPIP